MIEATLDRQRLRELFDLQGDVYDVRGGYYSDDPYPAFDRFRQTGPVHEHTVHEALGLSGDFIFQGLPCPSRRHFSVYDWATCAAVFKDDERFITNPAPMPDETPFPASILFMDGLDHRRYRRLVQPSFIPSRAVWWRQNYIESTVHALIDGFEHDGRIDLNTEFCAPIPLLTITGSFGVSIEQALDIRAAVTGGVQHQGLTVATILAPIITARREAPADDLISVLTQAEMTDEDGVTHALSDAEILGFSFLLLAAGSGTTWKQMGITLVALLANEPSFDAVKQDRSMLPAAVEESLRWMPTDPVFSRYTAVDVELAGVAIPAGSVVHNCLAAANRDPERWERPAEYDVTRPALPHLGFGGGPHVCLGTHVARAEIVTGIGALLDRLPNLRLDADAPAPAMVGMYERGPTTVPVRFD